MKNQKGFTLIELLVVVAIIGILSGIAFVSISGARESAYDTQIRSELSQIRSNAEQYYYGQGSGTYSGYDSDTNAGWDNIKGEIPACSVAMMLGDAADAVVEAGTEEEYQISIEDGDYAQSYAAWAPLCGEENEFEDPIYYCVDSDGNAGEYHQGDGTAAPDTAETNCEDIFAEEM